MCSLAAGCLEVTTCLGSVGVGGGVERIEGNMLALTLRWVGCGLAGQYLCNPISEHPMVSNVQTHAYPLVGITFASSLEVPVHTGPVIQVVRAEEIKLIMHTDNSKSVSISDSWMGMCKSLVSGRYKK